MELSKKMRVIVWIVSAIAAVIMLQTLWFKFGGAAESIYIFSTLGIEPWGRIGSGIVELIASILLMIPAQRWIGALLGAGTMMGAIASHLFVLGIEVENDGGLLFSYALVVLVCCAFILWVNKNRILKIFNG